MKTALLLVHGIGAQPPGETAWKFIEGLSRVAKVNVRSGASPVTLEVEGRTIVLYEVYWADLLMGDRVKGTANIDYLLPLAWYPWFNCSSRSFRAAYSKAQAVLWCGVLCLGGVGFALSWEVLAIVVSAVMTAAPVMRLCWAVGEGLLWFLKNLLSFLMSKMPLFFPPTEARIRKFRESERKYEDYQQRFDVLCQQFDLWLKKRRKHKIAPEPGASDYLLTNVGFAPRRWSAAYSLKATRSFRTAADDFFDEYVGDIQNYLDSSGGIFQTWHKLSGVSEEIRGRFHAALRTACESDCDEIQILSHSLGTVIAYHGLTGFGLKDLDPATDPSVVITPLARITHLFTIGSPLEKIRFIWPKLIFGLERYQLSWTAADHSNFYRAPAAMAAAPRLRWDNFWNCLDLVSGKLTNFNCWCPVRNHPIRGGASILRAHIAYERTSDFLSCVTESLLGEARGSTHIASVRDRVIAWGENLASPLILVSSILGGAAYFYYVALAIAWLVTWPFGHPDAVQTAVKWFLIFGLAGGVLWMPRERAAVVHRVHWSRLRITQD
jgi:hypothetical protein